MSVVPDFEPARNGSHASASTPVDLAEVWSSLVRGSCIVVEGFFTDACCALALAPCEPRRAPLGGRPLQILESILRGSSQNCISIDLGLSAATVALSARLALLQLGVSERPSRVHPLLMLAASAASQTRQIFASETIVDRAAGRCRVIEIPRPELGLERVFRAASLDVLRRLVEGSCYADIASVRGTSERTVANQVSAIFRRLRVSGRNELMHRLFRASGMLPESSPGAEPHARLAGEHGRHRYSRRAGLALDQRPWSDTSLEHSRLPATPSVGVLSSSIGVCLFPDGTTDTESLVNQQVHLR